MPRKGYDDEPAIRRVVEMMEADTGLSRHAAIKAVVGANPSNVRRIEQKMTRAALAVMPQPLPVAPSSPAVANGEGPPGDGSWVHNLDHREKVQVPGSRGLPPFAPEFVPMMVALAFVGAAIAVFYLAGPGLARFAAAISQLKVDLAGLLGLPVDTHAVSSAAGRLITDRGAVSLDAFLSLQAAGGSAVLPVVIVLHLALCALVLLFARHPLRSVLAGAPGAPQVIAAMALASFLFPSLSDVALVGSAMVAWLSLRDHGGDKGLRLPIVDPESASVPMSGIFRFGQAHPVREA